MKRLLVAVLLFALALAGIWGWYRRARPAAAPPPRAEIALTIIPGWDLRDIADYLVAQGVASSTGDVYAITGIPGKDIDSVEGSLAPETIRFYKGVSVEAVVKAFRDIRLKQITPGMREELDRRRITLLELLIMASIVEKETKHTEDRAKVADILWRRKDRGWALQVDSSVHYAIDKNGTVFTTDQERAVDSPWNTYKYPGLPPGPICTPSVESIQAALYPEKNEYWYFLSGTDGKMYYAKTLEEHNINRVKYLR